MFFQRLWSKGFAAHHVEGIVPQNYRLNRGAWKTMENEWADWIKYGQSRGNDIEIQINIDIDPPGAVRPNHFYGNYEVFEILPGGSRVLKRSKPIDIANTEDSVFTRVYFRTDSNGVMSEKE